MWVGEHRALVVSDLHLGKSERHARRSGGFWPPYENLATLERLTGEVLALSPRMVVTLGDSFDDVRAADSLDEETAAAIEKLVAGHEWVWVTGNHDPAPTRFGGVSAAALRLGGLTLRHIADPAESAEISGHYHPKARMRVRGRAIARKCFAMDARRIILPAFGAFTGGLDVLNPAFAPLIAPDGAVVLTGERAVRVPLQKLRELQG